ncbi:uncharacterized protein LOC141874750 isoform X2 [Acropora palmata]
MKKTMCYNEDHQTPSCFDALEKLEKMYANDGPMKWVIEQLKKIEADRAAQRSDEKLGKVIEAIVKACEKFESGSEVQGGVLDIISSLANHPAVPAIKVLYSVIGLILTYHKPEKPSVVQQLAKIVHDEVLSFNKKLQDQKFDGLGRRMTDQVDQLRRMRPGEKLDDSSLWNDYVQFMGELSNRFESPLPFKYDKGSLSKDAEVADFLTAVVTYCQAYSCFMALLTAVKGKFSGMGDNYKEDEEVVDRKIRCQRRDAVKKLAFLSDEKNLTFLGRLPYEGGKLTKILVLSRNLQRKLLVEEVRRSLGMPEMPKLEKVESAAEKVSRQSVKLRLDERHQLPHGNYYKWMSVFAPDYWVQFVNETDFPMRVVLGTVAPSGTNELEFVHDIKPHASHIVHFKTHTCADEPGVTIVTVHSNSAFGYLTIYLNGTLNSEREPPVQDARVIEFALSWSEFWFYIMKRVNIEEKTSSEFTQGQGTYSTMKSDEAKTTKTIYWFDCGRHYMAKAEISQTLLYVIWRFVIQDFDPYKVED